MNNHAPSERTAQTLKRIATVLRCTVEDLLCDQGQAGDVLMTQELLTLWDAIRDDESRQTVLNTAREVVRAQATSASP